MTETATPTQRMIESLSDYSNHFDCQPIDKFALTRSLAWNGHVRIGSSEVIDKAGPARPLSAKTGDQGSLLSGKKEISSKRVRLLNTKRFICKTETATPTQRMIESLSDYSNHFDCQPIDKFALTRSLAWNGHVRIGSSEVIDMALQQRKLVINVQSFYRTTMPLNRMSAE